MWGNDVRNGSDSDVTIVSMWSRHFHSTGTRADVE